MRLYIRLLGFTLLNLANIKPIKILQKYDNKSNPIILVNAINLTTSDDIVNLLLALLKKKEEQCVIRIVMIGKGSEMKIKLIRGYNLKHYYALIGNCQPSIFNYQMEIEVQRIESTLEDPNQLQVLTEHFRKDQYLQQLTQQEAEIYKFSTQLFQTLHYDDLFQFKNTVNIIFKYKTPAILKTVFSMYDVETGYTLLHAAIFHNKHNFLDTYLNQFGEYINANYRSIDGWLPFELALSMGNKRTINIIITARNSNLNLNFPTHSSKMVYKVIDSINLNLIEQVIKRIPLYFQQMGDGWKNIYEYLWYHKRFTQRQKKEIISLMHDKHLQFYDYYRLDNILYSQCKKYLPEASKRMSPKKQIIYNPNLKIISGEIIKCRAPPCFAKTVYLSVNSYIGAIQEYDINSKLNSKNDKQKLEDYAKTKHICLDQIDTAQILQSQDKSWYMKKQWYCFYIREKRGIKTIFACIHQSTSNQWISEIQQAINAWSNLQHKEMNPKIAKNYISIKDTQLKLSSSKKVTVERGYIDIFSRRLSLCQPEVIHTNKSFQLQKQVPMLKSKSHYNTTACTSMANEESINLSLQFKDFKMIQILGEGAFGQVFLVECIRNKKHYALKTFSKKKIILGKQTKFVIAEVNILKQIKHPFIITLHFTFQTPSFIYLGLEYCQGKDMAKHLNEEITFPEADVKVYAAEIVLALEYVHSIGIIYRDLKPENIMLGKDGHIMLVDFGLSKKTQNNFAKTFCGTPAYISPQMLQKKGVGRQTDFFSLGVVIYEFIFGQSPFYSENIHLLYDNIYKCNFKFPKKIDDVTKDLIENLLVKQPQNRLGSGSINQIKNHPYFSNTNWQKLLRKDTPGPKRALIEDLQSIQSQQQLINIFHEDFDYSQENIKINRFRNFSFVREDEFI